MKLRSRQRFEPCLLVEHGYAPWYAVPTIALRVRAFRAREARPVPLRFGRQEPTAPRFCSWLLGIAVVLCALLVTWR